MNKGVIVISLLLVMATMYGCSSSLQAKGTSDRATLDSDLSNDIAQNEYSEQDLDDIDSFDQEMQNVDQELDNF